MLVCANCGFIDERENFIEHPEFAPTPITVRSFGGQLCILYKWNLICPNCIGSVHGMKDEGCGWV